MIEINGCEEFLVELECRYEETSKELRESEQELYRAQVRFQLATEMRNSLKICIEAERQAISTKGSDANDT